MSKSNENSVSVVVLEYLNRQNRPYSAIDIFNNLHKVHGKTLVVKTLDTLAENGKIKAKTYGKQIVYVADQSQFPEVSDAEMKSMDTKIQTLQEKLKSTEESYRKLDSELRNLKSALTTTEAKEKLQDVTTKCDNLQKKISMIKSNNNAVSPEERKKIIQDRTQFVKCWRKRKRMANDMLDAVLEGYPKSKKELYEEIGIETDDELNIKPPEL